MAEKKLPVRTQKKYDHNTGLEICKRIAEGQTIGQILKAGDLKVTRRTVAEWALIEPQFSPIYAEARLLAYELMADDILDISDCDTNDYMTSAKTGSLVIDANNVQRSRLMVDTRKWILCKRLPAKWGDKIEHEVKGDITISNITRTIVDPQNIIDITPEAPKLEDSSDEAKDDLL